MAYSFKQIIEGDILDALTRERGSIRDIADRTGRNYYTVRNYILKLQDEGLVIQVGYANRSLQYGLAQEIGPNHSIPMLRDKVTNKYNKASNLLALVGQEDKMASVAAIKSLPRNITRILMLSARISGSDTIKYMSILEAIKAEMEHDYTQLANTLNLYKQVLDNDNFWDVQKVKAFIGDEAFDKEAVLKAYSHYYGETRNTEHLED